MSTHIFFLALFAVGFAQETSNEGSSVFDILQNLTEDGNKQVLQTLSKVIESPKEYYNYVEERMGCLLWESTVQQQNLNKSITEGVIKGMLKNKQFTNFQCISNNARDTLIKLDQIKSQIPVGSQNLIEKGLKEIMPYKMTLSSFINYIQDLYKTKSEEMKKTEDEASRKKILEEATKKMKLLVTIMEQISALVKSNKFKFIEEYINFAFATEAGLKNTQREGAQKIMKCVA